MRKGIYANIHAKRKRGDKMKKNVSWINEIKKEIIKSTK